MPVVVRPVLLACAGAGCAAAAAFVVRRRRRAAAAPATVSLVLRATGTYRVYVIGSALRPGTGVRCWSFFSEVAQPHGGGWSIDLPRDVDYAVEVRGYRTSSPGASFPVTRFVYRAEASMLIDVDGTPRHARARCHPLPHRFSSPVRSGG
jgi:hypothetical protein